MPDSGSPATPRDGFPMVVILQRRAKQRGPGETGALHFQRWLAECKARGYRVWLSYDESHCYAEAPRD